MESKEKPRFNHEKIENNWKDKWFKDNIYEAVDFSDKPKKYILAELPYPSGSMLHMGHMMRYTVPEIYSRFLRMKGYNVLFPMGWDSFGLPAETFAQKEGITPQEAIAKASKSFKKVMQDVGFAIDWNREINTCDPEFYKWTQWTFKKLWEKGLAIQQEMPVWWCEELGVLADEEVLSDPDNLGGKISERGGHKVIRKDFTQWVLDIPAYADRLIADLDKVDYEESVKIAQKNWIGRKEGANVKFITSDDIEITAFTTRPDTIFGVTFVAISPEHSLINKLVGDFSNASKVNEYIEKAKSLSDIERQTKEKTGIKLEGVSAIHPFTGKEIPIFVADYIMADFGTGAVMGVPGHDERDFEFAIKYEIPILSVIESHNPQYIGYMKRDWSVDFDKFLLGLKNLDATYEIQTEDKVLYLFDKDKLNDWVKVASENTKEGAWHDAVGPNFVMTTNDGTLYTEEKFQDTNGVFAKQKEMESSIRNNNSLWEMLFNSQYKDYVCVTDHGKIINSEEYNGTDSREFQKIIIERLEKEEKGGAAKTYKLRPQVFSRQRYWGEPIPLVYKENGEVEAVADENLPIELPQMEDFLPGDDGVAPLAKDQEWVATKDLQGNPAKRETDTMPTWAGSNWYYLRYVDPKNKEMPADPKKVDYWFPVDMYFGDAGHTTAHLLYSRFWFKFLYDIGAVPLDEPYMYRMSGGMLLGHDGQKMSKSKGNVINPQEVLENYGADAVRTYLAFIGPYEDTYPWNPRGLVACARLVKSIYEMKNKVEDGFEDAETTKLAHIMVKKMTEMMGLLKMNTSVSEIMIFVNHLKKQEKIGEDVWKMLIRAIAPFAPFTAEELWQELNGYTAWDKKNSVHLQEWPEFDEKLTVFDEIIVPVQINGKLRGSLNVSKDITESEIKKLAMDLPNVKAQIEGRELKKFIYVPGRIVNLVV